MLIPREDKLQPIPHSICLFRGSGGFGPLIKEDKSDSMYLLDCLYMCIHGHMDIHMMLLEVVHCTFACNIQTCTYTNTYVYIYIIYIYLYTCSCMHDWCRRSPSRTCTYIYNVYIPFFIQLELMKRPNFGVETSGGSPSQVEFQFLSPSRYRGSCGDLSSDADLT